MKVLIYFSIFDLVKSHISFEKLKTCNAFVSFSFFRILVVFLLPKVFLIFILLVLWCFWCIIDGREIFFFSFMHFAFICIFNGEGTCGAIFRLCLRTSSNQFYLSHTTNNPSSASIYLKNIKPNKVYYVIKQLGISGNHIIFFIFIDIFSWEFMWLIYFWVDIKTFILLNFFDGIRFAGM